MQTFGIKAPYVGGGVRTGRPNNFKPMAIGTFTCKCCSKEFKRPARMKPTYCSPSCAGKAGVAKMPKREVKMEKLICPTCSKPFEAPVSQRRKVCSKACSH